MPGNKEYKVYWEIQLDAQSPLDAAEQALAVQRDHNSMSTVFTVNDTEGNDHVVDLDYEEDFS